jgi:hypothetical protein
VDLLTDPAQDRFIVPQPYFTAAQVERLRHEKAREIECFLRMCFAWRRVRRLREAKLKMEEAEQLGTGRVTVRPVACYVFSVLFVFEL